MNDRVLSMIGLAARAGKIVSGEEMAEKAIRSGNAFLAVVAADASEATRKRFGDKCSFYSVPIVYYATKALLGHHVGKELRAAVVVTDEGFAEAILQKHQLGVSSQTNTDEKSE